MQSYAVWYHINGRCDWRRGGGTRYFYASLEAQYASPLTNNPLGIPGNLPTTQRKLMCASFQAFPSTG